MNSWVLDWMTENTHYKAPATELLQALPLSPPTKAARCMYEETELTDHYMQVLMKPLKPGQAPRTKFLVKELLFLPWTVYRFLTKTLSPIKGHDSNEEEVIGIVASVGRQSVDQIKLTVEAVVDVKASCQRRIPRTFLVEGIGFSV